MNNPHAIWRMAYIEGVLIHGAQGVRSQSVLPLACGAGWLALFFHDGRGRVLRFGAIAHSALGHTIGYVCACAVLSGPGSPGS